QGKENMRRTIMYVPNKTRNVDSVDIRGVLERHESSRPEDRSQKHKTANRVSGSPNWVCKTLGREGGKPPCPIAKLRSGRTHQRWPWHLRRRRRWHRRSRPGQPVHRER